MVHNESAYVFSHMLHELTEAPGPSGHEAPVRNIMKGYLTPWVNEVTTDRLGSLISQRGNAGPRVMLAGHLDEVGFLVTRITKDGYIKFQTLGGWWSQVLPAQKVEIITRKGSHLGVIGSKPPHLMKPEERRKAVSIDDLFIDIGVESKEEAEALGVFPGDPIVPFSPFETMSNDNRWLAKAMDNRLGCAVVIEVMRRLAELGDHPNQVFGVGTVMEEVGVRGARTSTASIKPDVAFALDVGIAGDTPGIGELPSNCKLGEGPALTLYDAGHIAHAGFSRFAQDVAAEQGIDIQYEFIQRGATDAAAIHMYDQGVPTLSLCIPARYIHSHTSIIDKRDVFKCVDWLVAMVQKLDAGVVKELQYG